MPDEKAYTARDLILAKREGFATHCKRMCGWSDKTAERVAAEEYPLPKITRPRVVTDSQGTEFRVRDGDLLEGRRQDRPDNPGWGQFSAWDITPERIRLWADLLANPTEEVDDAD